MSDTRIVLHLPEDYAFGQLLLLNAPDSCDCCGVARRADALIQQTSVGFKNGKDAGDGYVVVVSWLCRKCNKG